MANFAVIENNLVINIIVADDVEIAEQITGKTCIEYTNEITACIGYTYDETRDAFIPPKPEDFTDEYGKSYTFVLNEETCLWGPVIVQ